MPSSFSSSTTSALRLMMIILAGASSPGIVPSHGLKINSLFGNGKNTVCFVDVLRHSQRGESDRFARLHDDVRDPFLGKIVGQGFGMPAGIDILAPVNAPAPF